MAAFAFIFVVTLIFCIQGFTATIRSAPAKIEIVQISTNWSGRIAGSGVVWYHNFDSVAEINQFRWTSGYGGGQDPMAKGVGANFVTWQSSGGADGGSYMRVTYPAGDVAGRGSSFWWRPFNPMTGSTNGRGVNDPAASNSISLASFNSSDGNTTLNMWGFESNPGWYGHPSDQALNPSKYQGHDFYLQIRVRRMNTPGAPPDSAQYSNITGKFVWMTTTDSSYTAQELVTYGQSSGNRDQVGVQSQHMIYVGQNYSPLGSQPNESMTISNQNVNWRYSGGWDCLLYHITPGTNDGVGANRTRVEVWAQHDVGMFPAESGIYTKIWDTLYSQAYDGGTTGYGSQRMNGWNALILGIYHNGATFSNSFNYDYDQVIFSKSFISPIVR